MIRTVTLFLLFVFILSNISFSQEKNIIPGELIVQLKPGYQTENLENDLSSIALHTKELLSKRMNIWLFGYDVGKIADSNVLLELRSHQSVKQAQFNHIVSLRTELNAQEFSTSIRNTLNVPNDSRFNEQWSLNNTGQTGGTPDADIDAVEAWDFSTGGVTALGDTIVIAIVDGGCDLNHSDLQYWYNYEEIPNNNIDDDGNGYVDDFRGWNAYDNNGNVPSASHGTHVSGIAAARGNNGIGVSGVNWNAKIMPVAGSTNVEATVVKAYAYILEMRSRYNETNGQHGAFVVVTNASFGVDYGNPVNYPLWCAIYDSLGVQGIISCGATANANINVDLQGDIPTACPSPYLISVTNTTNTDSKNSGAAYGLTTIDIGAPGTSVLSTDLSNSYSLKTGTSMATPTVAGAVALLFSAANSGLMQSYRVNPSQGALTFKQFLFDGADPIPALQGITVTGGRLNIFNAVMSVSTPPDNIPPTTVSDLAVGGATSNSLLLNWTTPLDTTRNGVVAYDIRISASPINDSTSFYSAQQLDFNETPDTAGAVETLLVEGLNFSSTYYFALTAYDLWGNVSNISNSPAGTTYGAPELSVTPSSLTQTLFNNETFTDTIFISNVSVHNSSLNYNVSMDNNTFPTGLVTYKLVPSKVVTEDVNIGTKDDPAEIGGLSIEGSGGPDLFGYEWIDSNEPNGPSYEWNDISSTGTLASTWAPTGSFDPKDEGYAGPFNFGFDFKFYGITETQIYVSSNGFLTFSAPASNTFTNGQLPSTSAPNGIIAAFWDDLDGRTQGTVHYQQDGNKFIVQFTNWQKYSATGSLTFQYVLYSSGKIMVYYNNMNATLTSATIGIENLDGTDGLQVAYNAAYVSNNLALKISADPDWLAANTTGGLLMNGTTTNLELTFNTEDYPLGNYSMDVIINSNDPAHLTTTIPVSMQIVSIPVELTSLTASTEQNEVVLNWSTATETNNRGFSIERKTSAAAWQEVGFANGAGTSSEPANYSFVDKELNAGKYTYRLKQIDYAGSYEYSGEVEVEVTIPAVYSLTQNYPNPFNPATIIQYSVPEKSQVTISVYTSLGQLVKTIVSETAETGYHQVKFDASELTSGTYIYQFIAKSSSGSYIDSKKMLFVK